jgi:RecB family exonuclease
VIREARLKLASPSLVVGLDRCGLAVYLSRQPRGDGRSRGPSTPSARLGTAAHRILEWAANNAPDLTLADDLEATVRQRWHEECADEHAAAARHPAEWRYGPYPEWPRYATIQANLVVAVGELVKELAGVPHERRVAEMSARTTAGDIAGTIDLIVLDENGDATVIDHKVGTVTDGDLAPGGAYHTQVLLYAAMARDMGYRVAGAQVRPLGRTPVLLRTDDAELDEVLTRARQAVAQYNNAVDAGEVLQLAQPSEEACRWCPFLIDCPAVWSGGEVDLGDVAIVEGVLGSPVQLQRNGRFAALALTTAEGEVTISGLSTVRMPDIAGFKIGDTVRAVGLRRSADRSYRPAGGRVDMVRLASS